MSRAEGLAQRNIEKPSNFHCPEVGQTDWDIRLVDKGVFQMGTIYLFGFRFVHRLPLAFALFGTVFLAGCLSDGEGIGKDRVAVAEQLWKTKKPAQFSYVMRRSCYCPDDYSGPFLISASADSVLRVRRVVYHYPDNSAGTVTLDTVDVDSLLQAYAIDSAFATAYRVFGQSHETEKAKFNAEYGYPEMLETDEGRDVMDAGWGQYITEFQKL
jgi:hypothetical protein